MFARAPLHRSGGRRLFLCEPVSSDLNRGVANHATATTVSTLLYRAMFEGPTDRRVLDNGRVDTGAAVFSGSRPTGFSGSRPTRFSGSRPTGACICRRQVSEYHCRRDHRGRDCRHDSPHVCTSSFRPCVSLIHLTIKTEMTRDLPEEVVKQTLSQIPLGRWGKTEDVVGVILFLCSPLAQYITGQTIHVNGGFYMG